jgi:membrane-associated phospholipid phosphatase
VAMACAALTRRVKRWPLALASAIAYSLVAVGAATFVTSLWVQLFAPAILLVTGYWLSGMLFHSPQPWLEEWLLRIDHGLGAGRLMYRIPRPCAEALEAAYASVTLLIAVTAISAAIAGVGAVTYYWNLVLTAALASYAPLPWLRSRPPRLIERDTLPHRTLRRMNVAILDNASVQANTLPSGHVSSAIAASLGMMAISEPAGWAVLVAATLIAVAAVAGRYHYAVDCMAGAALSFVVWSLV